jgi:hypothetical protein
VIRRKNEQSPEEFWQDYEKRTGETVLARSLGRYLSGWEDFDTGGENPLWGLLIATGGGFRFHHFPQISWLEALSRFNSGGEAPKEKTIFIPHARIISVELRRETSWWKRIFAPSAPLLAIRYRTGEDTEAELRAETDSQAEDLLDGLRRQKA